MSSNDSIEDIIAARVEERILGRLSHIMDGFVHSVTELKSALGEGGGNYSFAPASRGGKRAPRGAMREAVLAILAEAPDALAPAEISRRVVETDAYKGRTPQDIYPMVYQQLVKLDEVEKTDHGFRLRGKGKGKK